MNVTTRVIMVLNVWKITSFTSIHTRTQTIVLLYKLLCMWPYAKPFHVPIAGFSEPSQAAGTIGITKE